MRFSIFPRNYFFYDLFEQLAERSVHGSELLCDLMQHFDNVEMKVRMLEEVEHDADNVTHALYRLVNQTFVTPLDREDIASLAQRMDDVVDQIEAVATTIRVYHIKSTTNAMRGLADMLRLQCLQVQQAIGCLRQRGKLKVILEHVKEINRFENEADSLYLSAMAELFQNEISSTDIIKYREVYSLLEAGTDSAEDVAHVLESIVLKHA